MLRKLIQLWRRAATRQAPRLVRLYRKADCGLCERALAVLAPLTRTGRVRLEQVDIGRDPELLRRYALAIPVLEIDGGPVLEWPFERQDIERALR